MKVVIDWENDTIKMNAEGAMNTAEIVLCLSTAITTLLTAPPEKKLIEAPAGLPIDYKKLRAKGK